MGHPVIVQRSIVWKTCTRGRWDPDRLSDCHCEGYHTEDPRDHMYDVLYTCLFIYR
jgi:hypothetical protein